VNTDPLRAVTTRATPQTRPADPRQVPNSAGGYAFALNDLARLRRFLVLGVDGGTYYATERELTRANAEVVLRLARERPIDLVNVVVEVSTAGRAPRQNACLFALAAAAGLADEDGRAHALSLLPSVARTGTHLFIFAGYVEQFRGWGPLLRRGVSSWYLDRPVVELAYDVIKYRQREGWSHRDLVRLAHPVATPGDAARRRLLDWVVHRRALNFNDRYALVAGHPELERLEAFERAQATTDPRIHAELVHDHGLPWEALPDAALSQPRVWEALLERGLPLGALLRQLPRLTRLGLLDPLNGAWTARVCARLTDAVALRRARVHPVRVLLALRTYALGRNPSGQTWTPSGPVVDALDAAFYAAFGAVEPTGKRLLLALDVSASMGYATLGDLSLTAREASAALALVTASVETRYQVVGFTSGRGRRDAALTPLAISPRQRLDDAVRAASNLPFGGTDCALPMLYALDRGLEVDCFVIYTDNETWAGDVHPHEALRRYRERTGIAARLVVVGMTSTGFTIADPTDPGTLDVVGFDAATPTLLSDFARGDV
jgi:60 kDa SS-A/Ro ribonucleoprotein